MMMRAVLFALALCIAPPVVAADAPVSPGAVDFAYGYFCARDPSELIEAEGTVAGVVNLIEGVPPFIATGTTVPAQIGVGFGVHILVHPAFAGPVDLVIEHPPMGPDGVTRQTWTTDLRADDPDYLGYSFDRDYELLTGQWTITATTNGRLVYRASFDVVRASLMPPVPCGIVPIS